MVNNLSKLLIAGFFATFICIGAFIKIPFLFVPMTLQFLFVNLAVLYQDKKYGVLSVLTYITLGLMGLPVFAGGGGLGYVLKPTFGYIIGFLAAAVVTGSVKDKFACSLRTNLIFSALNIILIYICGISYFYLISNFYLGSRIGITKLLIVGCLMFIPSDVFSGVLSSYLAVRLKSVKKLIHL
ncbi:MAG: biotin transporter BioY [Oscillospiraceae bacterium]